MVLTSIITSTRSKRSKKQCKKKSVWDCTCNVRSHGRSFGIQQKQQKRVHELTASTQRQHHINHSSACELIRPKRFIIRPWHEMNSVHITSLFPSQSTETGPERFLPFPSTTFSNRQPTSLFHFPLQSTVKLSSKLKSRYRSHQKQTKPTFLPDTVYRSLIQSNALPW